MYGFIGALTFHLLSIASPAVAQGVKEFMVRLQDSSPGNPQTGNVSITGTYLAQGTATGSYMVAGLNAGTNANTMGLFGYTSAVGTGGITYGVYGRSDSGTGVGLFGYTPNTSGSSKGVEGRSAAASGFGGYFLEQGASGTGVFGAASSPTGTNFGGDFTSASSSGIGVRGQATNSAGVTFGVFGNSASTSGVGVGGDAPDGIGIRGYADSTTGINYGGYFRTRSSNGYGVFAHALSTTGATYGIQARNNSSTGFSMYSLATATIGTNYGLYSNTASNSGYGVFADGGSYACYGVSDFGHGIGGVSNTFSKYGVIGDNTAGGYGIVGRSSSGSVTGAGIYGSGIGQSSGVIGNASSTNANSTGVMGAQNAGGGQLAVFSLGNFTASGAKSFTIDHPLDPENKILRHFCTEGPEALNAYSGNTVTDESGYAVIRLPNYFESINKNFRYQLTVVDEGDSAEFVEVKVVRKIRGNQFAIRTSLPHVEVSWRVEATRNDLWMQKYPLKIEEEKSDEKRGTYFFPELFGQPKSKATYRFPSEAEIQKEIGTVRRPNVNGNGQKG